MLQSLFLFQVNPSDSYKFHLSGMCNVLTKKVLSKMHKYKVPPCNNPTQHKLDRLPDAAFKHIPKDESMPFMEVQSTKQIPSWYSSCAGNWSLPTSDIFLVRHAYQKQHWDLLKLAWQGCIFSVGRQLIFGKKGSLAYRWYGFHHFKDSCVLCWPVTLKTIRNQIMLVEPDLSIAYPVLVPVTALADTEAWRF